MYYLWIFTNWLKNGLQNTSGKKCKTFQRNAGNKAGSISAWSGRRLEPKKVSLLEQKETIENQLLEKISEVLKIPVEAFQNFDEEQAVNLISCTFSDNAMFNNRIEVQNINPIDKIVQLHEEKIALYERMLKEKDEMMSRLEKLLDK